MKLAETIVPVEQIPPFPLDIQTFWEVQNDRRYPNQNVPEPARPYLKQVKSFSDFQPLPIKQTHIPREDARRISVGEIECPLCKGTFRSRRLSKDPMTGLQIIREFTCLCYGFKVYFSQWLNTANVPINYRDITLAGLHHHINPFLKGFPKQGVGVNGLIDFLKNNPGLNYLLAGKAETGKTTCMTALYQHALRQESLGFVMHGQPIRSVFKIHSRTLSAQFRDWETRKMESNVSDDTPVVGLPLVTPLKIHEVLRHNLIPRLFLEEIDKIKLDSKFQRDMFHELLDAIVPNNGQIVVTSNLDRQSLIDYLGSQHGDALVRRVCGKPNGVYVDFSNGVIHDSRGKYTDVLVANSSKESPKKAKGASPANVNKTPEPPPIPEEEIDFKPIKAKKPRVGTHRENFSIPRKP